MVSSVLHCSDEVIALTQAFLFDFQLNIHVLSKDLVPRPFSLPVFTGPFSLPVFDGLQYENTASNQ